MKHLILALLLIPCPHVTVLSVAPPNVVLTDLGEKDDRAAAKPGLVERLQNRMMELDAAIEAAAQPVWKNPGASGLAQTAPQNAAVSFSTCSLS